jgi:S-adenosylmethionine:tRNA ribosyltransferase-isomerase
MGTPISLFDYHLPPEQIAQEPMRPRDRSRLLVLDRNTGVIVHKRFFEIADELCSGDVLVMNDTKVFRARLRGERKSKVRSQKSKVWIEVFLLRGEGREWTALLRQGRKVDVGDAIDLGGLVAEVIEKSEDGVATLRFDVGVDQVLAFTDAHGEIPVPPYVEKVPDRLDDYQTVYARNVGSVAAPTAGFHFTPELIETLKAKGVQFEFVTLHVGIGTFRPVKSETLEEHEMHCELVSISRPTADRINAAKREGRRIIAVGTTTVRALEGVAALDPDSPRLHEVLTDVNLFITPGFHFKVIDGLITNFHLPKSTLIVLVSAFAGRERVLAVYNEAVRLGYRFFSFGDAMFVR